MPIDPGLRGRSSGLKQVTGDASDKPYPSETITLKRFQSFAEEQQASMHHQKYKDEASSHLLRLLLQININNCTSSVRQQNRWFVRATNTEYFFRTKFR